MTRPQAGACERMGDAPASRAEQDRRRAAAGSAASSDSTAGHDQRLDERREHDQHERRRSARCIGKFGRRRASGSDGAATAARQAARLPSDRSAQPADRGSRSQRAAAARDSCGRKLSRLSPRSAAAAQRSRGVARLVLLGIDADRLLAAHRPRPCRHGPRRRRPSTAGRTSCRAGCPRGSSAARARRSCARSPSWRPRASASSVKLELDVLHVEQLRHTASPARSSARSGS